MNKDDLYFVMRTPQSSYEPFVVPFNSISSGDPLYDFACSANACNRKITEESMRWSIKKIIFDPPYTILVTDKYGVEEKYVVKTKDGENFDELTGFVMAFMKMQFGESYKSEIRKIISEKAQRSNRNHRKEIKEKKLEVISLDWKEKLVSIVKAAIEAGKDGKEDHEDTI